MKLQAVTSSHLHHPRRVQQEQQPLFPSRTTPVDQTLPSLPSLNETGPQIFSVEDELREMLSKMTDVPADRFQGHVTLDELGIDSLMLTEIVSEIHEIFHISIPQDRLQDLQTVASLYRYIDTHESRQGSRRESDIPQAQATPVALPLPLPHTLPNHLIANHISASATESKKVHHWPEVPRSKAMASIMIWCRGWQAC